MTTPRPGQAHRGVTAGDIATWAVVEATTERTRRQLELLLAQDDIVAGMARRFANVGAAQRAGHVFEWQQELTFNLDAIAKGAAARAVVTEWLGEPHAAADLRILAPDGSTLSEVQAKVVASVAQRVGPVDGLSAPRYAGMQLLTPTDHTSAADDALGRRLGMPHGPLHERYDDVRNRLTDRIRFDDVESEPVTSSQLNAIADDPAAFVDERALVDGMAQVAQAAVGGAAVTAAVSAATTLAVSAVRSGSLHDLPWAEAGRRAAAGAVRGAAVAVVGQSVSLAGQFGLLGAVGDTVVEGAGPVAIARAVVDVAVVAHGVATGRLSHQDAALEVADIVTRSAVVWTCSAVGQAVIPVPVVGALVGGVVGQVGAALIRQGVHLAVLGRPDGHEWDTAYDELLIATAATELASELELEQLRTVADAYDSGFSEHVVPRLERIGEESWGIDIDGTLADLADLTRLYAATPLFASMADFDAFMADEDLVLDLRMTGGR